MSSAPRIACAHAAESGDRAHVQLSVDTRAPTAVKGPGGCRPGSLTSSNCSHLSGRRMVCHMPPSFVTPAIVEQLIGEEDLSGQGHARIPRGPRPRARRRGSAVQRQLPVGEPDAHGSQGGLPDARCPRRWRGAVRISAATSGGRRRELLAAWARTTGARVSPTLRRMAAALGPPICEASDNRFAARNPSGPPASASTCGRISSPNAAAAV